VKFIGLSYDGFYEVDERLATGRVLKQIGTSRGSHDHRRGAGK
jgi:hypothetical protein